MLTPQQIISELEKLVSKNVIDLNSLYDPANEFNYEPIRHYINSLKQRSKPETANGELFRSLVFDVLRKETFSEVKISEGFIDFTLKDNSSGNPILIELKPFYKLDKTGQNLKADDIRLKDHIDQVVKYLKTNEFVILTNLKQSFLFNRSAIVDEEHFEEISFSNLIKKFLEFEGLTDTIRRIEDSSVKSDLDKLFFEDLKKWYEAYKNVKIENSDKLNKDELIVLLLNKIIFIKTLEDYGLIGFKFLEKEYLDNKSKWGPKGIEIVFTHFFPELEEYFDVFYDTELFSHKFWDFVDKSERNLKVFETVFEKTLGLDIWDRTFGKGMLHYNYRQIDEDIFGKAYETFIAEHKKDSGIYYTPKEITDYMSKMIVNQLFDHLSKKILLKIEEENYEEANDLLKEFKNIKIIDTASGSGSFLIKVLRRIYRYYEKFREKTSFVSQFAGSTMFDKPKSIDRAVIFRKTNSLDDDIKLISEIILNHIYAIDIDERAIETAKTNIWKEAVKLNPKKYNARSLGSKYKHILPNLEINFINGDSLADLTIDKQIEIISSNFKEEIIELHKIRNEYKNNPFNPETIEAIYPLKNKIYERLISGFEAEKLPQIENPLFICVEFFFCFFDENGNPIEKTKQGFNGIISNPPWEAIKPIEKEFADKGKYEMDITKFKTWFAEKIEKDENFKNEWKRYVDFYDLYSNKFLRKRYLTQSSGDTNYFKLFIERNLEVLQYRGVITILVPSGFQTDEGCDELRKLVLNKYEITDLLSFENRGYKKIINGKEKTIKLFQDVDNRFKFSIINVIKSEDNISNRIFNAKFYMHDPKELLEKDPILYSVDMIKNFSPTNFSIMEFRQMKDYELCRKIKDNFELFGNLKYKLGTEFHMTNDSHLFVNRIQYENTATKNDLLILYEGKMIFQYISHFDQERYYILEKNGRDPLENIELKRLKSKYKLSDKQLEKIKIKLDYEDFRLVHRSVGSSTNERTLISTIVPPKVFIGHSMNYLVNFSYEWENNKIIHNQVDKNDVVLLMSLFNSLVLNYYIRNKISVNLTMNFIYELPIPEISKKQKDYIVHHGLTILFNHNKNDIYKKLVDEIGIKIKEDINIVDIRAELEVYIAKELYRLNKDDWDYLTSTFTYGADSSTKHELDEIIEKSKGMF